MSLCCAVVMPPFRHLCMSRILVHCFLSRWSVLLRPQHRRAAATGSLLFALQQFAGVNAVVFFSTAVFEKAGVQSAVAASALVMATNIAGTVGASRWP